ncbi:protein AF-10 isoform X2 [Anthonomus grandis grandis]|uniref:protein AF-10 isoform X2 n=1 Tax=Anthonomus grandis grandis TaxID=2921223 RepID=UPI0021653E0B|nr:protein AF-10 isoform X2 [Anthonomus grandis grandis]
MREMVGGCCVCSDDRGWSENPLVYCDGQSCTVAVHQACYGIVSVPTGPWYCCKCESQERSTKVKCELCPSKYGALKRTDNQGWAHVVCALYIPEVRFGNVSTMEPIQLHLIPPERFNKVCYICEEKGKPASATVGACMQCNKLGCKQQFHVTCAQSLGLLCEEAGNYLDNVKYCGYCQHHYSKLKKGGNVKTIPPYKPVADNPNSDSNSEKESESGSPAKTSPSQAAGKRRSGTGAKSNASKVSNSGAKSSGSQQKSVHSNNKGSSEKRSNTKTAKAEEPASPSLEKNEKKDGTVKAEAISDAGTENKDTKPAKKRRGSSRTPTPVQSEAVSVVVVSAIQDSADSSVVNTAQIDKKHSLSGSDNLDKQKKAKVEETTQSILSNQPVVALTSIATPKSNSPTTTAAISETSVPTSSIIQTAQAQIQAQQQQHHHPSLVVSVPLLNASLSPNHPLVANQGNPLTVMPFAVAPVEKTGGTASGSNSERATPVTPMSTDIIMPSSNSNQGLLSSEMSGGGLKITYEKQSDSIHTEVDMEIEMDTPNSTATIQEIPAKRNSRSQSTEKTDARLTRGKKRNGATPMQTSHSLPATLPKRSSRSQQPPSPPDANVSMQSQPGAFAAISQNKIKDSPPSSPGSESQSTTSFSQSSNNRGRAKARKSAPAAVNVIQGYSKEEKKENKLFTNGMTAPHMLGNQLNPNSTMHAKMTDHLSNELEAHSIYNNSSENSPTLVGPQLHHKVVQSARASSTGSSTTSGGSASGLSSMLGGSSCGGSIPQTLDQLLERQWEQGSQFLMEQAQHFDIASLLSCLHQLRAENLRLEEHVNNLVQRRDHLLAVNARLAIPLTGQPTSINSQPQHPNNIHPNMSVPHAEIPRPTRHSTGSYDRYPQGHISVPMENGLPPDSYPPGGTHRDSGNGDQPSPTVRHSPATIYSNNGLLRQCADTGGRAAPPRAQPYSMGYDRPGSSHSTGSQQMVIRRDRDPDVFGPGSQPS